VQFTDGRKEFMRNKIQLLILQNYETVKQKMLTMGSTMGIDVFKTTSLKNKQQAIMDAKLTGYGFLASII